MMTKKRLLKLLVRLERDDVDAVVDSVVVDAVGAVTAITDAVVAGFMARYDAH
jgi:hypothetical protein